MKRTIRKVPQTISMERKKRVCAYARVSSGKDAMLHSLSAQISSYSRRIQSHTEWQFAGVYVDEAKTGTKDSRENFQRMLDDCRNGQIDLVITKSISRFARNTVTLLQTVRELKTFGVDVFFEEQNIHSMSGDGELMMTILASYAQEESRSVSENQKWRIKRNFESGQPWDGTILGYRLVNGRYEIVESEAELVRRIFRSYLAGDGYVKIANMLKAEEICSRVGGNWAKSGISKLLSNYTYTGNLLLQKTFTDNHLDKRTLVNQGQLPQYHVERSHPAIIDMDTFLAVQQEKARRAKQFSAKRTPRSRYPFTGLLVCEHCGKHYRRKMRRSVPHWICSTYDSDGKNACLSKQIPEAVLEHLTAEVLGVDSFDTPQTGLFSEIRICSKNRVVFRFRNGTEAVRQWKDRSRSESWTDAMREQARQKSLEVNRNA